eukprot:PITA_06563
MMPSLSFLFAPLFLLLFIFSFSSCARPFHDDRQSLLQFKKLITSDPYDSMANWGPTTHFCNWTAVTCSHRHPNRVVGLDLSAMDLQGTISPFLGNLSFLRSLNLSHNTLHGHIPPQLGRLFRLKMLWLEHNQLEGSIPSHLGSCRNLTFLSLALNNLGGNIPVELGSLVHLKVLRLRTNWLTGSIPYSLGNLSALIDLDVSTNNLTGFIPPQLGSLNQMRRLLLFSNELIGNIPHELGMLTQLIVFHAYNNVLSGTIPLSLSNISTLLTIDISINKFTGNIPQELGQLIHLKNLYLYQNDFSGVIPISLSNISSLSTLAIATNKLTGNIPHELGLFTNLKCLYLHENNLSGTIPSSLSNISTLIEIRFERNKFTGNILTSFSNIINLRTLSLWGNHLNGMIPTSIGNCSQLDLLYLNDNALSGSVPIELGKLSLLRQLDLEVNQLDSGNTITMPFLVALTNCSQLNELRLDYNKLSGVLPIAIGKLSIHMSILSLSNNMIEGNIPPHINNLRNLTFLNLAQNVLNGSIPPLGNLEKLERLYLGNNRLEGNINDDFKQLNHLGLLDISTNMLSGKIPNSLCPIKQLRTLSLHDNYFSDKIPATLRDCENLEILDLSHNRLSGSIPREVATLPHLLLYLNLSWNLLEGPLPPEIGKLGNALAIDISSNLLTSVIPTTLGSCIALESLNLSNNSLEGSIPDSLGNLQNLVDLDLSSNSLSGTIPITLNKLKNLHHLNLSFNTLKGEISIGFFTNMSIIISLIGNSRLCGPQVFSLPPCRTPTSLVEVLMKVLLPIVGAIGIILSCLLLKYFWRGNLQIKEPHFLEVVLQKLEHQRISYQELMGATNGFIEANLLGKGNIGSVYKGILSDGTLVAIKVFNLQSDQVDKSFKVECKVLQKVRHRNLVRIITSCSNLHFKSLVFELMSNGSLEKHLYINRDENYNTNVCELGLKSRLDIAIDVAHAIEYLHHYSPVQVVHCDIKPSNVLLDEDMVGHVTDFGIARLVGATTNDSFTSTLALRGSVGYIAPEYGLGEKVSTQGDVYSYGILLLEMLTRKKPTSDMFDGDLNLSKWVNLALPNRMNEVIDNCLLRKVDEYEIEENDKCKSLHSLLRVGLLCSKDSPQERPTMRDVLMVLESVREDLVKNKVASKKLRPSTSTLLSCTSATRNNATTSNDESSTF